MRLRSLLALAFALPGSASAAQDFRPWLVLGPFDHPSGSASVDAAQPPERELASMKAGGPGPKLDAEHRGKGNAPIRWRALRGSAAESVELDVGLVDFNALLEPPPSVAGWNQNAVVYLYRRIDCSEDRSLAVRTGSDDGLRLWLNGALLVDKGVPRPLNLGDEELTLELKAGANHLLVKVAQGGGGWSFRMASWERVAQEAIDRAIDRGVDFLLANQLIDGTWGSHEGYGGGQTAYCVYTLLKCGLPAAHPAVQRGLAAMAARRTGYTYSIACEILALVALGDALDRAWLAERTAQLVDLQESSGLYGYPVHPDGSVPPQDLSCTLFATLALRAAVQAGERVPERTWRRLIDGSLRCFDPEGDRQGRATGGPAAFGFRYRPDWGTTGSMTTAGLGILAIADAELGGKHSKAIRERIDGARAAGLRWIEKNMTWTANPGQNDHHYFFIYGMERVGSLLGLKVLGGLDWYWSGADYLVRNQLDSGAWVRDDLYVDTILALLFLKRATAPTSGARQEARARRYATSDPAARVQLHASGDTPLSIWVGEIEAELSKSLAWPGEGGSGPRVARVEFLAKPAGGAADFESVGVDVGDPERPAPARRFAIQHTFPACGDFALRARVHVVPPPGAEGLASVLETPELVVRISGVLDPRLVGYASDHQRNLLSAESPRWRSSSQLGEGERAAQCGDGRSSTRWRSAADDATPWIELALARQARVERILLVHALPRPADREGPRARRIELLLNGSEKHQLELDPNVLAKSVLALEKPVRLRELRITILDSIGRELGRDGVGFAEIELQ